MQTSNQRVPYQGYPYVNPPVHDAPSIAPDAALRWDHLPRRQVELPVLRTGLKIDTLDGAPDVITDAPLRRPAPEPPEPEPEPDPVVYIDVPEPGGSYVSADRTSHHDEEVSSSAVKREPSDALVVYIELPDAGSGEMNTHQPREEPQFVQETIFFNPFENRRIDMYKESPGEPPGESPGESDAESAGSSPRRVPRRLAPARPTDFDPYGASSSGGATSSQVQGSTPGLSSLMSKEAMLYGQDDNGFPMSPIPVSEFPEPPPAYAEIDRVNSPVVEPQDAVVEQPRTQVILPRDSATTPIGLPNPDRKYLACHHCGTRVHSLVVRENGALTHCTAISCLFMCMLPCVAFIYCTDMLKTKTHYCPSCNKVIGYELPFSNKIVYVN